jgi:hypothetical protein
MLKIGKLYQSFAKRFFIFFHTRRGGEGEEEER